MNQLASDVAPPLSPTDFENSKSTYIIKNDNSLTDKFYFHDISKGPLKNYSL